MFKSILIVLDFILQVQILWDWLPSYQATNFTKLLCISFINSVEYFQQAQFLISIAWNGIRDSQGSKWLPTCKFICYLSRLGNNGLFPKSTLLCIYENLMVLDAGEAHKTE